MLDWIVRQALVAIVGVGQMLAPQTIPAASPDESQIKVEASLGPGSVYSTGNISTVLTDTATTNSQLFVPARGAIIDISLRLRIAHPRLADLDIQLISPDGTPLKVLYRVGGASADFGAGNASCTGSLTTFDDDATTSILGGASPYLGVYRPDGRLSSFHGRGANGIWTLRITDHSSTQVGTLYCWELVMRHTLISGDLYGNGRSDLCYWPPASSNIFCRQVELGGTLTYSLGVPLNPGAILAPADVDGDGMVDPVWFTPSIGEWRGFGLSPVMWGGAGDVPVPGDYNADGIDDLAVWRPSTGTWYVRNQFSWAWGGAGDIPVPADYNGDGTTDMAVWRPRSWRVVRLWRHECHVGWCGRHSGPRGLRRRWPYGLWDLETGHGRMVHLHGRGDSDACPLVGRQW